jgi:hypothetical protein
MTNAKKLTTEQYSEAREEILFKCQRKITSALSVQFKQLEALEKKQNIKEVVKTQKAQVKTKEIKSLSKGVNETANTLNYGKSRAGQKDWFIVGVNFDSHPQLKIASLNISRTKAFIRNSGFMTEDSVRQLITEQVLTKLNGFKLGGLYQSPNPSLSLEAVQ